MKSISFVIHGKARGVKKLKKDIFQEFHDQFDIHFYLTMHARHAEELTTKALEQSCDYLIAVGGDGTVSEVVNAYIRNGGRQKYHTILGVIPLGTGNDFVKSLGGFDSLTDLRRAIVSNNFKYVDAGQIDFERASNGVGTSYFANIADLGIGAEVVAKVNGVNLRKIIFGGTLVFFFTALQTFITYRHKMIRIKADDFIWEGPVLSLVVANGRFFGSGLGIAPDARIDDGSFQIVIFGDLSVWDYLKNYGRIRKSLKIELPEVQYFNAESLEVETEHDRVIAEADGEIVGQAPMKFYCLREALPFLVD